MAVFLWNKSNIYLDKVCTCIHWMVWSSNSSQILSSETPLWGGGTIHLYFHVVCCHKGFFYKKIFRPSNPNAPFSLVNELAVVTWRSGIYTPTKKCFHDTFQSYFWGFSKWSCLHHQWHVEGLISSRGHGNAANASVVGGEHWPVRQLLASAAAVAGAAAAAVGSGGGWTEGRRAAACPTRGAASWGWTWAETPPQKPANMERDTAGKN